VTGTNSAANGRRDRNPDAFAYGPETIRAARQRAHLRQEELATLTGASKRAVGRWESVGVPHRALYLGAIEEVLGLGEYAERPAPAPSALRPLDSYTVMEHLAALAAHFAALESGRAVPPAPRAERYRWAAADAPSARRAAASGVSGAPGGSRSAPA
jgi:transcriptional regulator with XRE-family HTH domain